jgi:hypothetical protein
MCQHSFLEAGSLLLQADVHKLFMLANESSSACTAPQVTAATSMQFADSCCAGLHSHQA